MPSAQDKFREWEQFLDTVSEQAIHNLQEYGITFEDNSQRKYQGKVDYLWIKVFVKRWELPLETALVRIQFSYGEPVEPSSIPNVKVRTCAEKYRQGQVSSVREIIEETIDIQTLAGPVFARTVIDKIREGEKILGLKL